MKDDLTSVTISEEDVVLLLLGLMNGFQVLCILLISFNIAIIIRYMGEPLMFVGCIAGLFTLILARIGEKRLS